MISKDKIQLIAELTNEGRTAQEVASQLGINEKTVRRYRKKPPELPTVDEDGERESTEDISPNNQYNTDTPVLSTPDGEKSVEKTDSKQDKLKARHYAFVVYPSEAWYKAHCDGKYDGTDGWGEAPDDWRDKLVNTGLPFVVSPLHDKDVNANRTLKKPHWHVIVSWGNTTTYRNARMISETILKCPRPQILSAVEGMYRYLTHKDNPEKAQYSELPICYNNWQRPLDNAAITSMMAEIRKLLYIEDCREYGELVSVCKSISDEYFDIVSSHTYFFDRLCASYRNAPLRTLSRVCNEMADDTDAQEKIIKIMERYGNEADEVKTEKTEVLNNESND